jgi:hypothetical protein
MQMDELVQFTHFTEQAITYKINFYKISSLTAIYS